jgi:hypothetical protein
MLGIIRVQWDTCRLMSQTFFDAAVSFSECPVANVLEFGAWVRLERQRVGHAVVTGQRLIIDLRG